MSSIEHKKNCIKTSNYGNHQLSSYDSTERYPISVLRFPSDKQKSAIHPTQKPVALEEYLIKTYTNTGDLVYDACFGSGTTAIAAINTGRSFIVSEKDPVEYEKGKKRIIDYLKYNV